MDVVNNGMHIDEETGEILFEMQDHEQLEIERTQKIENVALWIKNLNAEAVAIREEEKHLAERRKAKEQKAENLTKYVQYALQGEKLETSKVAITYRKSVAVEIIDKELVPQEFIKVETSVDKTAIKKAIAGGNEVAGAQLVEKQNMSIK